MNKETSNPYRPPAENDSRHQQRSLVYTIACLLWCGLAIGVFTLRSAVMSLFEEFGLTLPVLTRWLLTPTTNLIVFLTAGSVLLAGIFIKSHDRSRRFGQLALLLAVVAIALVFVGFGLPMIQLLQELS